LPPIGIDAIGAATAGESMTMAHDLAAQAGFRRATVQPFARLGRWRLRPDHAAAAYFDAVC
jgi:hypothetical protein